MLFRQFKFVGLCLLLSGFSYSIEASSDEGKIGEIRYSILTLQQFQAIYGPEWEIMAGQNLAKDSELLHLWGKQKLPDARGDYLRCANAGRPLSDGKGNPMGDLPCGAYLDDQFKEHNHGGITGDDTPDHTHGHGWPGMYGNGGFDNGSKAGAIWDGAQTKPPTQKHRHSIKLEGDVETRPRSIIVNAYIKVREGVSVPIEQQVTAPAVMDAIVNHPSFRPAVENVVIDMMNNMNR